MSRLTEEKLGTLQNVLCKSRGKDNLSFCLVVINEESLVYNSIKLCMLL